MSYLESVSLLYISGSLSILHREILCHLDHSACATDSELESLKFRQDELTAAIDQLRVHALTHKYGYLPSVLS